jgi:hypothetical protein
METIKQTQNIIFELDDANMLFPINEYSSILKRQNGDYSDKFNFTLNYFHIDFMPNTNNSIYLYENDKTNNVNNLKFQFDLNYDFLIKPCIIIFLIF